jgi:spore germination cell wall hydrolase CwlJ-like protein
MGRRSSRRMWHAVAAFVSLPLIGLGVFVAVTESRLANEVELFVASPASAAPYSVPGEATKIIAVKAQPVTRAGKQLITASLGGAPGLGRIAVVRRATKADRLNPTTSEVALTAPPAGRAENSLFMNASYSSPFNADFQVDAFRPTVDEIAYQASPDALEFRYKGETQPEFEDRERRCLSTAIYFEARGESKRGQIAVAQVILNRVRSPLFPETICGVVFQGQMRKGCQFSFACDGHTDNPRNKEQWGLAQGLAKEVMSGDQWLPEVGYSTFYHANYVKPRWARHMRRIDKIGQHIFYKNRNEKPYTIEASADPVDDGADSNASGYLLSPTLSLASAVSAFTGASAPSSQAMSLGYAASE